jgi:hypothetical protein
MTLFEDDRRLGAGIVENRGKVRVRQKPGKLLTQGALPPGTNFVLWHVMPARFYAHAHALDIDDGRPAGKRGPASRLQQQMERIQRLPRAQQRFVMQMLDTVLQQAAR